MAVIFYPHIWGPAFMRLGLKAAQALARQGVALCVNSLAEERHPGASGPVASAHGVSGTLTGDEAGLRLEVSFDVISLRPRFFGSAWTAWAGGPATLHAGGLSWWQKLLAKSETHAVTYTVTIYRHEVAVSAVMDGKPLGSVTRSLIGSAP